MTATLSSPPPSYAPGHRTRRRRWRVASAALAVLCCGWVAVTAVFFVSPPLGSVAHPQAVVVLGGYGDRLARAEALARRDGVATIVVSVPVPADCPAAPGLHVECFEPDPATTQGEARAVPRLARSHRWRRLLVVVGTPQVTRARLRLGRCYSGALEFSGVDPTGIPGWIYEIAYNEAAMVKALVLQPDC